MATYLALRLIKDLVAGRVVFYWSDAQESQASPLFATHQGAHEWWLLESFALYEGPERRRTHLDRRMLDKARVTRGRSSLTPSQCVEGRRYTDIPSKVHLDKCASKLREFRNFANYAEQSCSEIVVEAGELVVA